MRELEDFQYRILGASNPGMSQRNGGGSPHPLGAAPEWVPLADIAENADGYHVALELPQIKKEDVKVTVEEGVLYVSGQRPFETEDGDGKKWHRLERAYGSFSRSFALPDDSDTGKFDTQFRNGMLEIRISKSESAKPNQIEVKVN